MIGLDTNILVRYIAQDGRQPGCDHTATFDKRAAAGVMTLLKG